MFTGVFSLPPHPLHQRMIQPKRSWGRAHGHTTTLVPAFVGKNNDWRCALFWIGDEHIHLADLHTGVAADTEVRVEYDRPGGGGGVGGCVQVFHQQYGLLQFFLMPYNAFRSSL